MFRPKIDPWIYFLRNCLWRLSNVGTYLTVQKAAKNLFFIFQQPLYFFFLTIFSNATILLTVIVQCLRPNVFYIIFIMFGKIVSVFFSYFIPSVNELYRQYYKRKLSDLIPILNMGICSIDTNIFIISSHRHNYSYLLKYYLVKPHNIQYYYYNSELV